MYKQDYEPTQSNKINIEDQVKCGIEYCTNTFTPNSRVKNKKWCSPKCAKRAQRNSQFKVGMKLKCAECKLEFTFKHSRQRFCDALCERRFNNKKKKEKRAKIRRSNNAGFFDSED